MHALARIAWIAAASVVLLLLAGRAGVFAGRRPTDLGVHDGLLKPPSPTGNSVSSQAAQYPGAGALYARIEPIRSRGDAADAVARIARVVQTMPGARIVERRADYLYAQFTTRWLRFVDDVEFYAPPSEKVMHVRSASRLGRRDFGVNRKRVEALRERLQGLSLRTPGDRLSA